MPHTEPRPRRTARPRPAARVGLVAVTATAVAVPVFLTHSADAATRTFHLFPSAKTLACLAAPGHTPTAVATVASAGQNQTLTLNVSGIKPNLSFDLFTVEKSPFLANGQPDPRFNGTFGLAWYQSDLQVKSDGTGSVHLRTILNPEIFGFDASTGLAPTNTFHVGFWFNRPADAAACGFTGTTPFNGAHNAGPVAMITRPNANGKGPLG